jgi:hypothetical protein
MSSTWRVILRLPTLMRGPPRSRGPTADGSTPCWACRRSTPLPMRCEQLSWRITSQVGSCRQRAAPNMKLFCFASRNLENIWLGVRANKWAVATVSDSAMRGRITKAERYFMPGAHGLLYCNPTQSFTTPFIATSKADPSAVVTDVWPEAWVLPFSMRPLGDPRRQVHKDHAAARGRY